MLGESGKTIAGAVSVSSLLKALPSVVHKSWSILNDFGIK
jgi:hypothetical protein